MPHFVDLEDVEGGAELRLRRRASGPDHGLHVYLFATGGVTTPAEAERLRARLERRHLGNAELPAELYHVGARSGFFRLRAFDDHDAQRRALQAFVEALPETSGAFGSFWGETLPEIAASLDEHPGFPVSLHYFTDKANRRPYEWNEDELRQLFQRHGSTLSEEAEDAFLLIWREGWAEPFIDGDGVSVIGLEDFLSDRSREAADEIKRIVIRLLPSAGLAWPELALPPHSAWREQASEKPGERVLQWIREDGDQLADEVVVCLFPEKSAAELASRPVKLIEL